MYNPKMILQEKVDNFIRKYKEVLTDKECEYIKVATIKLLIFKWFKICIKVSHLMQ